MTHRQGVLGFFRIAAESQLTLDLSGAREHFGPSLTSEIDRLLQVMHSRGGSILTLTADGKQLRCWQTMPKRFDRHSVDGGELIFSLEGARLHRFFNCLCERRTGRVTADEPTNVTIWVADTLGLVA
ncbi:MAG: hypothetical protein Q7S15_00300 [bacterium]|nr:hypothetical protein [bacterium]